MEEHKKFKQQYLDGEVAFEELYRLVGRWKYSDDNTPLREVLGINGEEEDVWIEEGDEALQALLDAAKKEQG